MAASTNLRLVDLNSDALISSLPEVGDTPNQPLSFSFPGPSVSMAEVSLLNVPFRVNGSASGNGYIMISQGIWHFAIHV